MQPAPMCQAPMLEGTSEGHPAAIEPLQFEPTSRASLRVGKPGVDRNAVPRTALQLFGIGVAQETGVKEEVLLQALPVGPVCRPRSKLDSPCCREQLALA